MARRVLITGASGFIGSFLVESALRQGFEVVAGIRRGSPRTFLKDPALTFLELDYGSTARLTAQLEVARCTHVIHCAGTTGTKGTGSFQEVNVTYTRNLIDALAAGAVAPERFIYIGSLAAQGPGDPTTLAPLRAGDPEKPITAYAKSKLDAEQLVRSASFPKVILRPTAVYGPRDKDFLELFRWIKRGISPTLGGAGQRLSFVYVKDLADATVDLLLAPSPAPLYLISDGRSYATDELSDLVAEALGKKYFRLRLPTSILAPLLYLSDHVHQWSGRHPFLSTEKVKEITSKNWQCDSSPLWRDLGRQPGYDLKSGVKETAEWYRNEGWL